MDKKKKVLHIVEAFGGGIFTFLVDLVNATSDEFDVTILYAIREETPANFKEYFKDNVKFIQSQYMKRDINIKNEFRAIKEVKKIIKEEKPDIIHLHSSKAGITGRMATLGKKIKVLYNPHGFSFLMKNISKMQKNFYWLIEKIISLKKGTIIACSKGEYREAKKINKKAICINNGIDINKINEETKNLKDKVVNIDELSICMVGRINYQKNPKLFNKIAEENPEKTFTWIGDGDLRKELVSNNIEIMGWKSREEVLSILNDNDIFILPSLWEGLPIALLEAMYMKKVCIVSNVIGNKDVIEDNINGFIAYEESDYTKIINSLNLGIINRITENARKDIEEEYNMENMIKSYKKIYNQK